MRKYSIHEAKTQFSKLLQEAQKGEEIIIINRDKPVAKLIPFSETKREIGWCDGQVWFSKNFNDIPEGFEDYT